MTKQTSNHQWLHDFCSKSLELASSMPHGEARTSIIHRAIAGMDLLESLHQSDKPRTDK